MTLVRIDEKHSTFVILISLIMLLIFSNVTFDVVINKLYQKLPNDFKSSFKNSISFYVYTRHKYENKTNKPKIRTLMKVAFDVR